MKDLNFICLSHKHAAIGAMGHNHHRTVLIARPRILLLKHHRELHRNIGIVVEILIESRAVVVESLNEVGTNVVAQFAIFGEAVVLILIEPTAESSIELLCAARQTVAVEGGEELTLVLAQLLVILSCQRLPLGEAEELYRIFGGEFESVNLLAEVFERCCRTTGRDDDIST